MQLVSKSVVMALMLISSAACSGSDGFISSGANAKAAAKSKPKTQEAEWLQSDVDAVEQGPGGGSEGIVIRNDAFGSEDAAIEPTAVAGAALIWKKADLDLDTKVKWLAHGVFRDIASGQLEAGDATIEAVAERAALVAFEMDVLQEAAMRYAIVGGELIDQESAKSEARKISEGLLEAPKVEDAPSMSLTGATPDLPNNQKLAFQKLDEALKKAKSGVDDAFAQAAEAKRLAEEAERARLAAEAEAQRLRDAAKAVATANALPIPRAVIVHSGTLYMANYGAGQVVDVNGFGAAYKVGISTSIGCEDWRALGIFDKFECKLRLPNGSVQVWDKNSCVFVSMDAQPGTYCATCEAIGSWPAGTDLASKRNEICVNVH